MSPEPESTNRSSNNNNNASGGGNIDVGAVSTSDSDEDLMADNHGGYQLLPQEPDAAVAVPAQGAGDNMAAGDDVVSDGLPWSDASIRQMLDATDSAAFAGRSGDSSLYQPMMSADEQIAISVWQNKEQSRTNNDRIPLDDDKCDIIKQRMGSFTLPVPPLLSEMTEDQWRQKLDHLLQSSSVTADLRTDDNSSQSV